MTKKPSRGAHLDQDEPRADDQPSPDDDAAHDVHGQIADEQAGADAADPDQLGEELAEAKDRVLRIQAELENYRKRSQRELQDALRYAALPLARDLLPVLDNIQRAIDAAENAPDSAGLLAGVRMVADQLREVLVRHEIREIEAHEQPFDPNFHQAISQFPSDQHAPNTVVQVVQPGYQLHDRVVRPSQVIVSKGAEE